MSPSIGPLPVDDGIPTRATPETVRAYRSRNCPTTPWCGLQFAAPSFISQTVLRVPRYRICLVLYGGASLSVVASTILRLSVVHGRIGVEVPTDGLWAAIGIAAFWTIVGLRIALVSRVRALALDETRVARHIARWECVTSCPVFPMEPTQDAGTTDVVCQVHSCQWKLRINDTLGAAKSFFGEAARSNMDAHPYIPNSDRSNQARMLRELGIQDIEDLYSDIPAALRYDGDLDLPAALPSESELRRHMSDLLAQNSPCGGRYLNFLGAGCYQHDVPAICDEINGRSEFLTAYSGQPYEDHGRWQALWEYTSLMGELLNLDVVNIPTYDACQAAATSVRMAARITGRKRVLVAANAHPDTLSHILCYGRADLVIDRVPFDRKSGQVDSTALEAMLSSDVAAVYFENPSYLGAIEAGQRIAEAAHRHGALCVAGVDPITLGVLAPPADFGADITCGDLQTLGMHMQFGGGHGGFIAVPEEQRFLMELPSRLYSIAPTSVEGEYGFGEVAFERTSLARRENGKEFVGTAASLWGITAGVFLALMGPSGMRSSGKACSTGHAMRCGCCPKFRACRRRYSTGPFSKNSSSGLGAAQWKRSTTGCWKEESSGVNRWRGNCPS